MRYIIPISLIVLICLVDISLAFKNFSRRIVLGQPKRIYQNLKYPLKSSQPGPLQVLTGGPLIIGCWNIAVNIGNNTYQVSIDSGSSDLLIPGSGLNGYKGPTYSTDPTKLLANVGTVGTGFADGSSWNGRMYSDLVTLNGLSVVAPFAVMQSQVIIHFFPHIYIYIYIYIFNRVT